MLGCETKYDREQERETYWPKSFIEGHYVDAEMM